MNEKILNNKKIVIMGIANNKSIAYGCYKKIVDNGGIPIVTYQNERMRKSLQKIMPANQKLIECDVSQEDNIQKCFNEINSIYGKIDGIVHSIAFAPKNSLYNDFIETKKEDFDVTMNISVYSLIAVARYGNKIMNKNGSIIALTFMGSVKAIPNYNVMGVAKAALESSVRYLASELGSKNINVNSVSAGAQKTLAVSGVKDSGRLLKEAQSRSVTGKNITNFEVGNTIITLLSELTSGITGECIYVDNGVHLF